MSDYAALNSLILKGKTVILDGAIGTELRNMGVPLHPTVWSAISLKDYPSTTQRLHELYIEAGADIITTNTYTSARHNLEPLGLGGFSQELNLRAVMLAQAARERAAQGRKVWIAGAISAYGISVDREPGPARSLREVRRPEITADYARRCLNEQADIMARGGADFLIAECIEGTSHRRWVMDACRQTGLPFWVGFQVRLDEGQVCIGRGSKKTFDQALDDILADDIAGITLLHSTTDAIMPALAILKRKWKGPMGVYPEARRDDNRQPHRDEQEKNAVSEDEFVKMANHWMNAGARLIGGCCGFGVSYIKRLTAELPRLAA